jgi:hypothetical protein
MRVDLPDESGNVISIEVARKNRIARAFKKECLHWRVEVDTMLAQLKCLDCELLLNPTEWIAYMAEHWKHVQHLMDKYREAKAALEEKQRTKCQHCGKFTPVRK